MSSDTRTVVELASTSVCTYCRQLLSGDALAIQTYPSDDSDALAGVVEGGVLLCPDCANEPITLLDSWQDHAQPPVDADQLIGESYSEVANFCSFCAESLDTPAVVGVECYRCPGETLPAYSNYTLCEHCQQVFETFLCNVRDAAR